MFSTIENQGDHPPQMQCPPLFPFAHRKKRGPPIFAHTHLRQTELEPLVHVNRAPKLLTNINRCPQKWAYHHFSFNK